MSSPPSVEISHHVTSIGLALQPELKRLLNHPLYAAVNSLSRLRLFMREHVFAVWDFMSLLKRLQQEVCGTRQPWLPQPQPHLSRFVNEIVLAEESDTDGRGGFASHFDLYISAMRDISADAAPVLGMVDRLRRGDAPSAILDQLNILPQTREFVRFNLELSERGTPWQVASVFCFGREDVIPEMFRRLLPSLEMDGTGNKDRFRYYLDRHIELDEAEHGPLSRQLVGHFVRNDPQRVEAALSAARRAIVLRIQLWDGILGSIHATA